MRPSKGTYSAAWLLVVAMATAAGAAPFAYVTNADDTTVSVIDTAIDAVVATVPVPGGPYAVAVNGTGTRVYITHPFGNLVSVLDAVTNTVAATIAVGERPFGLAIDRAGSRVYVANYCGDTPNCNEYPPSAPGSVSVIDTATNDVTATIPVGPGPAAIAVNPVAPRAYVSSGDNSLSIIDTDSSSVFSTVVTPPAADIIVNAAGTSAYLMTAGFLGILNLELPRSESISLGAVRPFAGAVDPAERRAFVTDSNGGVGIVDLTTRQFFPFYEDFGSLGAWGIATPDGRRVYVANPATDTVTVLDLDVPPGHGVPPPPTIHVGDFPIAFGRFIAPASACFGLADGTTCDDGNVCTTDDACSGGRCAGTPANGTACDDVDDCTANDRCVDGACHGDPQTGTYCFEGSESLCMVGRCDAGVCVFPPECDDGDACTVDTCLRPDTVCQHTPVGCDDGNPCTTDSCDHVRGCQHLAVADGTMCDDDGDVCNGAETCIAGACTHGEPPECDDHDECTQDGCDRHTGCVHSPAPPAATLPSIGCRVHGLATDVAAEIPGNDSLLAIVGRVDALLGRAAQAVDPGKERRLVRDAVRRLLGLERRIRGLARRNQIAVATVERLLAATDSVVADAKRVLADG